MHEKILDFTRKVLFETGIRSYIIPHPYVWKDEYDSELRKSIWESTEPLKETFQETVSELYQDNAVYDITDTYFCEYIYLKLPNSDTKSVLLIGPFTHETLTERRVFELCNYNSIPDQHISFMRQYYASVPSIADERWFRSLINCLTIELWGAHNKFSLKKYSTKKSTDINYYFEVPELTEEVIHTIEARYKFESQIIEYISHGNWSTLETILESGKMYSVAQRFPDSVRDNKNILITLNTICRKAAEQGHVHPVYLDEISHEYAVKIENSTNIHQLTVIGKEMVRKYCLLVQLHSLKNYSQPIQKTINLIGFNLTSDLTLKSLAQKLSLNSSYLSALFKKETGTTLTEYVNARRIEHSIHLLDTTSLPIQEVATLSGIYSLNYFTKVFKKHIEMTPSAYRKRNKDT